MVPTVKVWPWARSLLLAQLSRPKLAFRSMVSLAEVYHRHQILSVAHIFSVMIFLNTCHQIMIPF